MSLTSRSPGWHSAPSGEAQRTLRSKAWNGPVVLFIAVAFGLVGCADTDAPVDLPTISSDSAGELPSAGESSWTDEEPTTTATPKEQRTLPKRKKNHQRAKAKPKLDPNAGKVEIEGSDRNFYASPGAVETLTSAAEYYNYTIDHDEEMATFIGTMVCERVADGSSTWPDQIDEDTSAGAPPTDARAFNSLIRDMWCPEIGL